MASDDVLRPAAVGPPLTGRRVRLRAATPQDYEYIYALTTHEQIGWRWRYRGVTPNPDTFSQALWHNTLVNFVIERVEVPQRIGFCQAFDASERDGFCHLGLILDPSLSRMGWAIESGALFVNYLFTIWNFRKLYATVTEFNLDNFASVTSHGFVIEGRLTEHEYHDGRYWDLLIMSMTRGMGEGWPQSHRPPDPTAEPRLTSAPLLATLRASARRHPDRIALVHRDTRLTYAALVKRSRARDRHAARPRRRTRYPGGFAYRRRAVHRSLLCDHRARRSRRARRSATAGRFDHRNRERHRTHARHRSRHRRLRSSAPSHVGPRPLPTNVYPVTLRRGRDLSDRGNVGPVPRRRALAGRIAARNARGRTEHAPLARALARSGPHAAGVTHRQTARPAPRTRRPRPGCVAAHGVAKHLRPHRVDGRDGEWRAARPARRFPPAPHPRSNRARARDQLRWHATHARTPLARQADVRLQFVVARHVGGRDGFARRSPRASKIASVAQSAAATARPSWPVRFS